MKWLARLLTPEGNEQWRIPPVTYHLIRAVDALAPSFIRLSAMETRLLSSRLKKVRLDRPIYICGIARAGTTITLEMISRHPVVGTHFYTHMPVPYLPYWWAKMESTIPLPAMPAVERVHKDGLMVTKDSPEAVEEAFWQKFFPHLHDESRANVLTAQTENPGFETFYRDHIRKLLLYQGRSRYAVKNNYNLTRLSYLKKLNPDARFVLVIRHPVNHIASLMKQHRIFCDMEAEDPRTACTMNIVGHREFGVNISLINTGDGEAMEKIQNAWENGREVVGWAIYWASVYRFVADQLASDPALANAALVVRYEDLCENSGETIDRIIAHTGLPATPFGETRAEYVRKLCQPRYYRPKFTDAEVALIHEKTRETAARFGYTL